MNALIKPVYLLKLFYYELPMEDLKSRMEANFVLNKCNELFEAQYGEDYLIQIPAMIRAKSMFLDSKAKVELI